MSEGGGDSKQASVTSVTHFPSPPFRVLPYGEQQGSFCGVAACSNRDDGFFSGENNYVNHLIYTGFRYQCVEYARRFLLLTTGCVFDACGRASEIYKKDHLTHVETGEQLPLTHNDNGKSLTQPTPGDIIIYPYHPEQTPWGHVGVISYVEDHRIGIAEQNQFFGSFISPRADYMDGELCVGRFVELHQDPATGAWSILEKDGMPQPIGWLSYPRTTRREMIYKTFEPKLEHVAVRSTPLDDPAHPHIFHFRIPEPIEIPSGGSVSDIVGMYGGSGESFVGAGTATARVIRYVLQLLFHRAHIGGAFLSLPSNPLGAEYAPCAAVDRLFTALAALGSSAEGERQLTPALAQYFGLPEEWIAAMQREFAKGELHMCALLTYDLNAVDEDLYASFVRPLSSQPPEAAHTAEPSSQPQTTGESAQTVEPHKIRVANPHDEAWHLLKVNFGTLKAMVELPQLANIMPQIISTAEFQLKGYRGWGSAHYRFDFANYLKAVEEQRGPRTAFTIVLSDETSMTGPRRELVGLLESYCARVKYPVRVVAEADLRYSTATGILHTQLSDLSPSVTSPVASTPLGDYEVDFLFHLCEWDDVLRSPEEHRALYDAALDHKSDVVFAKPLWTYLCTGLVHDVDGEDEMCTEKCEQTRHVTQPMSIKFFDIVRRLFELSMPRQAAETWDQEVSEYKDSCRRLGLRRSVSEMPTAHFFAEIAMVNFAGSAMLARTGGKLVHDPKNTMENDGQPAGVLHLFSTANDD